MEKVNPAPSRGHKASILRYWRAIEMFAPQRIPSLDLTSRMEPVVQASDSVAVPWSGTSRLAPPISGKVWRFQVYCGIYKIRNVTGFLERKFGQGFVAIETRESGHSCLFTFTATGEGRPLLDTFTISTAPWAVSRTLKPGPKDAKWLDGFERFAAAETESLVSQMAASPDDEDARLALSKGMRLGRRLRYGDLVSATRRFMLALEVERILGPTDIRIAARQVSEKFQYKVEDQDFLNSFYLKDLAKVASSVENGECGAALAGFLAADEEIADKARIDVRKDLGASWDMISPALFPEGRWPSASDQKLYSGQQLAVNTAISGIGESHAGESACATMESQVGAGLKAPRGLKPTPLGAASGLCAINGPPGTGKTTILRDMVAGIVVERAKRLAALARPQDAFAAQSRLWTIDGVRRPVTLWNSQFLGFEIVIASNNNAAVENVSLELPASQAVSREWESRCDYYREIATRMIEQKAWALMTARLGNRKNCSRFRKTFWFGESDSDPPGAGIGPGFLRYLQGVKQKPKAWQNAVGDFHRAVQCENKIRNERSAAWEALNHLKRLEKAFESQQDALKGYEYRRTECGIQATRLEAQRNELAAARQDASQRRTEHHALKPGFVDAFFTVGRAYRAWQSKDSSLQFACEQADVKLAKTDRALEEARAGLRAAEEDVRKISGLLAEAEEKLSGERARREDWKLHLGAALPDWWEQEVEEKRELSSPWADQEWNEARTRVFIEALHLHRAFIECNARQIQRNLLRAMDLLAGRVPADADPLGARSAWATLFFITPVISTTFASFDRLFAHLKREELGWLLIDEAGQCAPQAAAGALWRSRRAIVTGDPMQLEPINPLPESAQRALREHFGVEEQWAPANTSAQRLADRASIIGTYIQSEDGGEDALWVGCPLRVHRRCERPMFDIANKIAYGGQMVSATPALEPRKFEPSCWIDVKGTEADGHWIPAEGIVAEMLLTELLASGAAPDEIFLLSPFRAVARALSALGAKHKLRRAGTIHRAQGKEADIVILVLGGNPAAARAKEWASDKPNLLNVAVSRAKRRFYIIGNREAWLACPTPYFADAAELLAAQPSRARTAGGVQ
ncbi:MAG: AAA domain-containing protein [Bryobacteraceae bacterium]